VSARLLLEQLGWRPGQRLRTDAANRAVLIWPDDAGAPLVGARGDLTLPAAVRQMCAIEIRPGGGFALRTAAIVVEQTANLPGGIVHPLDRLTALHEIARRAGIGLHCDGARLWHAHITTGTPLDVYGRLFDSVCVCLSKGLGAPAGSVLAGSRDHIADARNRRLRAGGAMRQTGVLAAAGLYALDHHLHRLTEDHHRATLLARALAPAGVVDPARVHTNMVLLNLTSTSWSAAALTTAANERDVRLVAVAPRRVRAVTHRDLTDRQLHHAISVLNELIAN
jgi:threonine aldolase